MRRAALLGCLGLLGLVPACVTFPPSAPLPPNRDGPAPPLTAPITARKDEASPRPSPAPPPLQPPPPAPPPGPRPMPINLATALHLAGARPLDIALASEQVRAATARLDQARVLWLPTLHVGFDVARHDGRLQDIQGNILTTSRSSFLAGAGPSAVFAVTDALFQPLAARQLVRAREADLQSARNDALFAVADAYFALQGARGELAGTHDVLRRASDLADRAEKLAEAIVPPAEALRARTELSRQRVALHSARERWRLRSADLARILRLDPTTVLDPLEAPHLPVTVVDVRCSLDELIPLGLRNRPELASGQAVVEATLTRLRTERLRPLLPSVLLRGNGTNPAGTLSSGVFGGGLNGTWGNWGGRNDLDLQVLWEFQNLGFGNRARVAERQAENRAAVLELFRVQDRVAAEVAAAHAEAQEALARTRAAEDGVKDAVECAEKNLEGMGQTRRAGNVLLLVVRPQEAVAAVQALAQAYRDYYAAVADANRAQFRLYRALGQPAQALTGR